MFFDLIIFPSLNSSKICHSTSCSFNLLKTKVCAYVYACVCMYLSTHTYAHKCRKENKNPWVLFMLANCSWDSGLSWNVVDTPRLLTLKRSDFPIPSRDHLQTASWLGVGICDHLPSSVLGFCVIWICACLLHIVRVSMSSYL